MGCGSSLARFVGLAAAPTCGQFHFSPPQQFPLCGLMESRVHALLPRVFLRRFRAVSCLLSVSPTFPFFHSKTHPRKATHLFSFPPSYRNFYISVLPHFTPLKSSPGRLPSFFQSLEPVSPRVTPTLLLCCSHPFLAKP